jgi:hypothetical protein
MEKSIADLSLLL